MFTVDREEDGPLDNENRDSLAKFFLTAIVYIEEHRIFFVRSPAGNYRPSFFVSPEPLVTSTGVHGGKRAVVATKYG